MTVAAMKFQVPALLHFKTALCAWLESNDYMEADGCQTVRQ